jgi:hypothetical protein
MPLHLTRRARSGIVVNCSLSPRASERVAQRREWVVQPATRTTLTITTGLLIAAAVGCFFVAGWYDSRKYTLSGVPSNHYAVNENGRTFYVPRGGPPLDQRPQVPLTAEQYRHWEENEQSASLWAGITALCFVAALGTAVWLRVARRIKRLT